MTAKCARTVWMMMMIPLVAAARAEDARFGAVLTAFDALARPGAVADVRAKLEHDGVVGLHPHMRGYPLAFSGPAVAGGAVLTAAEGAATVAARAPAAPGGVARVEVRFAGSRNHRPAAATARVFAWPAAEPALVVDIDGTISDLRERDVIFADNAAIPAIAGAVDALTRLARSHRIIYLTARDESLYNKSRGWLEARGFPEGPLFTRDYNVFGPGRGAFKRQFLVDLRRRFPGVVAGVTDTPADAQAYLDAGLKAIVLGPEARRFPPGAVVVPSWQAAGDALEPAGP